MTVPNGQADDRSPAILFDHGYVRHAVPDRRALCRLQDPITRSGYIVFKSVSGHGSLAGATSHVSLPRLYGQCTRHAGVGESAQQYGPDRWQLRHSLGGQLTLRAMVVSQDVKASTIWGGVVAPYANIRPRSQPHAPRARSPAPVPPRRHRLHGRPSRQELTADTARPSRTHVLGLRLAQQLPG